LGPWKNQALKIMIKKSLFFQSIGTTDLSVNIDKSVTIHSSFAPNFLDVLP